MITSTMNEAQAKFYWGEAADEELQAFIAGQVSLCPTPGDQRKVEAAKVLLGLRKKPIPRPGQNLSALNGPAQPSPSQGGAPAQGAPAAGTQGPQNPAPPAGQGSPTVDALAGFIVQMAQQAGPPHAGASAFHHGLWALAELAKHHKPTFGSGAPGPQPGTIPAAGQAPGQGSAPAQPASRPLRPRPTGMQPFTRQQAEFYWSGKTEQDMTDWVVQNAKAALSASDERKFWAAMFLLGPKAPTSQGVSPAAPAPAAPAATAPVAAPAASQAQPVAGQASPQVSPWIVVLSSDQMGTVSTPQTSPIRAVSALDAVQATLGTVQGPDAPQFLASLTSAVAIAVDDQGQPAGLDPAVFEASVMNQTLTLRDASGQAVMVPLP